MDEAEQVTHGSRTNHSQTSQRMDESLPSFLVVGAAKSGTTALHHYLRQHPDVFLPRHQEPSFFAFEDAVVDFRAPKNLVASVNATAITELEDYRELFREGAAFAARGEISPVYLYWPGTAERIRQHVPDVRLCAILRNPVDRAFSAFMHAMRDGKEPLGDFAAALTAEPRRIRENWGFLWRYTDLGRYSEQLRRYYHVFPAEQIRIYLFEDLLERPAELCAELFEFIGVDPILVPDVSIRYNASGLPRSRMAQTLLNPDAPILRAARTVAPLLGASRVRRWHASLRNANLKRVELPRYQRAALIDHFAEEIEELQALIGRDLSSWRVV